MSCGGSGLICAIPGGKLERLRGFGVAATTSPHLRERDWLGVAELAEEAGYQSFWSTEDTGREAFGYLGAVAMRTRRVLLGPAVVNTYSRSPVLLTQAIDTLDMLSEGRAVLGLGLGNPRTARRWHAHALGNPAIRMRDYVAIFHAASHGKPEYIGAEVSARSLSALTHSPSPIPVLVGSAQPDVLGKALPYVAGWMPSGPPELIEQHRAMFEGKMIVAYVLTSANADSDIAVSAIRRQLVAYATRVPYLRRRYEQALGRDRVDRVVALAREGKESDAALLLPDDYVRRSAIAGTPGECRSRVRDYLDAGADGIIFALTRHASLQELYETVSSLAPPTRRS